MFQLPRSGRTVGLGWDWPSVIKLYSCTALGFTQEITRFLSLESEGSGEENVKEGEKKKSPKFCLSLTTLTACQPWVKVLALPQAGFWWNCHSLSQLSAHTLNLLPFKLPSLALALWPRPRKTRGFRSWLRYRWDWTSTAPACTTCIFRGTYLHTDQIPHKN